MLINDIEIQKDKWKLFKNELKRQGRTYHWASENLGLGYQYTYRLFNGKVPLPKNNVQKINELLEVSY